MKKLFALIFIVGCADPTPPVVMEEVKIISVYNEIRLGSEDGTTIVERKDRFRVPLRGKLGKKGDIISVDRSLLTK